jgi:hypothetical protein
VGVRNGQGVIGKQPVAGTGGGPPLEQELGYAVILLGAGGAIGTIAWLVANRVKPNADREMGEWIGLGGAFGFVAGLMYFVWAVVVWPIAAAITIALCVGAAWLMGSGRDADD